MEQDREHRIRERAHHLWEQAGRPDGRDQEFWHAAERELAGEAAGPGGAADPSETTGLDEDAPAWRDPAAGDGAAGDGTAGDGTGSESAGSAASGPEADLHIGGAAAAKAGGRARAKTKTS